MLFYLNDYSVYEDISLHILRKGRMRRTFSHTIQFRLQSRSRA